MTTMANMTLTTRKALNDYTKHLFFLLFSIQDILPSKKVLFSRHFFERKLK